MGSGASRYINGAKNDLNADSKKNFDERSSLTSTAALQLLLEQEYLRENLRDFVSTQWEPSLSDEDFQKYVQLSPRTLAMNCVDFWTDIQDYSMIKPSLFQSFRANHIYERYVVHGASHLVSNIIMLQNCFALIFFFEAIISNFPLYSAYVIIIINSSNKVPLSTNIVNDLTDTLSAIKHNGYKSTIFSSAESE